jgi:hypothetical protein
MQQPIDEIKKKDLNKAIESLKKVGLVSTYFKTTGLSKEDLLHSFENFVEDALDSDQKIPRSVFRLYEDIFVGYKEEKFCRGPMYEDCLHCPILEDCQTDILNNYLNIKHWVLEYALKVLSPSAFKIFMYLSKIANYRIKSNNFGRCWRNYDQIRKATGVKGVRRCLKQLMEKGLIDHKWSVVGYSQGPRTIHQFTVIWYKMREEFRKSVLKGRKK